jgi:hypothetical protein
LQAQERAQYRVGSADAAQKTLDVTNQQYLAGAVVYTPVFLF